MCKNLHVIFQAEKEKKEQKVKKEERGQRGEEGEEGAKEGQMGEMGKEAVLIKNYRPRLERRRQPTALEGSKASGLEG